MPQPSFRPVLLALALAATFSGCSSVVVPYTGNSRQAQSGSPRLLSVTTLPRAGMGARPIHDRPLIYDDAAGTPSIGFNASAALPKRVDLRPEMPPVRDQGSSQACTAFATVAMLEYLLSKDGQKVDLSERAVYYASRLDAPKPYDTIFSVEHDTGSAIELAVDVIKRYGAPTEKAFPFPALASIKDAARRDAALAVKPSEAVVASGKPYTFKPIEISGGQDVMPVSSLSALKRQLAKKQPVAFGILLYPSYDGAAKTGEVPLPAAGEAFNGAHGVLCVGYDDTKRVLIMRNSYGTGWGQAGYFTLPYDYLKRKEPKADGLTLAFDAWSANR